MARIFKYNEAQQKIIQLIVSMDLSIGDRLPGERELAHRLGVSQISVHHAMDLLQSSGIVKKRQGAGSFFTGHVESVKHDSLLGVVNIGDHLFPEGEHAFELAETVRRYHAKYKIISVPRDVDPAYQEELLQCDRFIVTGFVNGAWLNYLGTLNCPMIQVGFGESGVAISQVQYDWSAALQVILKRLHSDGLKRIGFLLPDPKRVSNANAMERHFIQAMKEVGLPCRSEAMRFVPYEFRMSVIADYMSELGDSLDALVTMHTGSLMPFAMYCLNHGGMPEHLKLVVLQESNLLPPDLPMMGRNMYNVYFKESNLAKAVEILYEYPCSFLEDCEVLTLVPTLEVSPQA